jgi:hypothetical protein
MNQTVKETRRRPLSAIALTLLLLTLASARPLRAEGTMPGRLWAEFGLGAGQLSEGSNPASDGGGGFSADLIVGGRLNPRWSLGLDLGGMGIHPANRNYDSNNTYSSIWGESITEVRAVVQYEPAVDHGWLFNAGAGQSYYHNKALEDFVGLSGGRIGDGSAWGVRAGYDWPFGRRGHLQAALGIDSGRINYNVQPLVGAFHFTIVAASVSLALR